MRAYHLDEFGSLSGLAVRDQTEPTPKPHEIVVRVRARSLNYRDLLILHGRYPVPAREGIVPVSDGAGEVVAIGEDVRRFAVGDRVAATYFPRWTDGQFGLELAIEQFGCTLDGMLADLAVVDEQALVDIPSHLSFEEAATLPCAAVTAWSSLTGPRRVLAGESVLTIGTGGVALFALQFAKVLGACVVAVTSSPAKAELLARHGADSVVDPARTTTGSTSSTSSPTAAASTTWSRQAPSTRCRGHLRVAQTTVMSPWSPSSARDRSIAER